MKVKIKGLVFVGFAAAILSANAMAAQRTRPAGSSNTVTSQAFTEAKYEWLSDKVGTAPDGESELWNSEDAYPSMNVLKTVADAVTATNNATQAKSTADYQLGGDEGTWKTVEAGTYVAAPVQGTTVNDAKIDIKENMIVGTKAAVTSGTNQLTTAAGVKAYAQKISDTANQISDGQGGWKALDSAPTQDSENGVTSGGVYTAVATKLDHNQGTANEGRILVINAQGEVVPSDATGATTYQPYETAANKISGANGSWKALNSDVTDTAAAVQGFDGDNAASTTAIRTYVQGKILNNVTGDSTTEAPSQGSVKTALATKENLSDKAAAIVTDSTAANYNADSTDKYASTKAVYDYVRSQTGGTVIPTMDTTVCNATTPCALVAEASGAVHWRTMATATNNGGACGDATGNCQ